MELYSKRSGYVLLGVIALGIGLYLALGSIAKFAVERVGSQILGVDVSIARMNIDTQEQSIEVENIRIDNPKGYQQQPYALTIKRIEIDTEALLEGHVKFSDVKVQGADVFLVVTEDGSNFAVLKDNINAYRQRWREDTEPDDSAPPDVSVRYLAVSGARLHPTVTMVDQDIDSVVIPKIEMEDLGGEEGMRPGWAVAQIWHALTNSAIQASSNAGLLQGLPHYHMNRIQGATELPGELMKGTQEGMKELFGRRW